MSTGSKLAVVSVSLVVLAAVVFFAWKVQGREKPVEVRIEVVERHDLTATVRASGWIRPRRAVDVQSDVMGRIVELRVEEGAEVRRGDLLLRIDPTQMEAMVARASAAVSEAQAREAQALANLQQAERAVERAHALLATQAGAISQQGIEELETQVRVAAELATAASHGVAQTRAALREADNQLARTTIRSPLDGVVTRLNVEVGEMAIVGTMNNPGSVLLTISDLGSMEAVVRVHETDVPAIRLADSATVEIDAFPRRLFTGTVTRISHSAIRPAESALGRTAGAAAVTDFEVVITLHDPPDALRPDLSATAEIVTGTRSGVLAVPIIALTVRERRQLESGAGDRPAESEIGLTGNAHDVEGVFLVRHGRSSFQPVQVGITGREYFEIVAGLSEGDSVVAGPYEAIRGLDEGRLVRALAPESGRSNDRSW